MDKQFSLRKTLIVTALGMCFAPSFAIASEADLMKRIEALQADIKALKAQQSAQAAAAPAPGKGAAALSATDGITISGKVDVGIESSYDGRVTRTPLQSHKSAIDFGGQRKLSADLTGLFMVGTTISPDATGGTFATRNSFVGLRSNSWGTILAGVYDDPFKQLSGTAAQLWGNADAMEVIINGKANVSTVGATMRQYITRNKNVVQYMSPKFSNVSVVLHYSMDEVNGAVGTRRQPLYAGLAEYSDGKYNFGIASSTFQNFSAVDKDFTALKLTAGMKMSQWSVGMAYSTFDNSVGRKTNNWMLGGSYKLGPTVLKANYGVGSESMGGADDGSKMLGLEVDYPLDKNTTLYGYYATIDNDTNGLGNFTAGTNVYVTPAKGLDPRVFGLAVRYKY
ncbi:MAG: porin [Rhodocyclaceae bacterium]|nr:MAG: porin [Rhodocyclaceae bacterium]TND02567.1 MAG: porin [Rhodocyclaceae bacterium]